MKYGLVGGHRTGKTTLAEAVSQETDLPLVVTKTSDIIKSKGLDCSKVMTLGQRIDVQRAILEGNVELWAKEKSFITDRTPLDMIGYTLAEISTEAAAAMTDLEEQSLVNYIEACYLALNENFHGVMYVPRVIPLADAGDKQVASLNRAYMEGLGFIMLGAAMDHRTEVHVAYLTERATDLNRRVAAVVGMIEALRGRYEARMAGVVRH